MASLRTLQRSFTGGEISPEMFGRIDDAKFQSGLAKCRNFVIKPQGPAQNRAGFQFVREVKNSAKKTRLIPFTYSTTQTMVIEVSDQALRFHSQGATLLAGSPTAYKTSAVVTMTIASPGVITWAAHGFANGDAVVLTTTGALPTGLVAGTTYYVVGALANTFNLAVTVGGAAINTTGVQSGVHTGHKRYVVGDLVLYLGSNYYCTANSYNNLPTNVSFWYVLPSAAYEIPTPYLEADLFDLHYVQSADVLTIVHPNYAPRELRRLGATTWTLTTISFAAPIAAPTAPAATPSGAGGISYSYVVTTLAADGISESAQSSAATCANNLFTTGQYNTISWAAVATATRYNVYKLQGGLYGYIGQTAGLSIIDDNIAPDLGKTPPIYDAVFAATGEYPASVSYFEQRRCFAGTAYKPQNIWMTKSGTESVMSYSLPIRDDDRIAFRVAAREANTIRHIVPLTQLLLLTSSAEWRVSPLNSDSITPTTISVRPQSYVGANNVQPSVINNTLIYAAARGGHVRECAYNWQANGFISGDLSIRAPHLFDTYDVLDMCYSKAPMPIVWFVSSVGNLLGLTYVPEQQIGAWHWHDTDGVFESVTAVAEGSEDIVYCVIRRNINGHPVRYVERMASRQFVDPADAFFVDAGLTYDGAAATVISGLDHLEGKIVNILADGAVHPQLTVTGGSITLEHAASKVQIGLPIVADAQTLPVAAQIDNGSGQGRYKNVNKVWLRVFRSSGVFIGPDADNLVQAKQRTTEPYGSPPDLKSEEIPIMITPSWADSGQIFIRQSDPLPLTLASLTLEVAIGG